MVANSPRSRATVASKNPTNAYFAPATRAMLEHQVPRGAGLGVVRIAFGQDRTADAIAQVGDGTVDGDGEVEN